MRRIRSTMLLLAVTLTFSTQFANADWTRFRGPNGAGIPEDSAKMPVRWSPTANLKWKTDLPGAGVSCPIIVGDRVYITAYSAYGLDRENPGDIKNLKRHLVALDRETGKEIWTRTIDPVLPEDPYEGIGVTAHGYASSTPVSDGQNVYVFFGKSGAFAFNKKGDKLWHADLGKESDPRKWGSASSPILYKNLLIVPATAESEALVALDTKTGKEAWRQEATGFENSWCTPILVQVDDKRTDLVIGVTQEIWGFNPDSGKLRWFSEAAKARSFCSSPVAHGDVAYAIEGQTGLSIAVRAGGSGDVTKSHVLWTGRDSGRFGSPIVRNNRLYSFNNGVVSVLDAMTGDRVSQLRLRGGGSQSRGGDYASPILADDKFYMVRRSGDTFVIDAKAELEIIAVNRVTEESEDFSATPAADKGQLFIRSDKRLYCVTDMGHEVPDNLLAKGDDPPDAENDDADNNDDDNNRRPNRGDRRGFDPEAMFKQSDANSDGKLTGHEISERLKTRMDRIDADKDGAVTLEEFRNGLSRRGGGRNRPDREGDPREGKPDRPQRPTME